MDLQELKDALPKHLRVAATPELLNKINNVAVDPDVAKGIQDNFVTWIKVLTEGKYKTEDYLNAVTYVSHKLMGYTNQDSWAKTFPHRHQRLVLMGTSTKDIAAHVSAYHNNKLVGSLMEQSIIPSWLLNRDAFQEAINKQVILMRTAQSEKVQMEAANSLLTHLKPPETKKIELDVGLKNGGGLDELKDAMLALAGRQKDLIIAGVPTAQIAKDNLVKVIDPVHAEDVEFVEVKKEPITLWNQ